MPDADEQCPIDRYAAAALIVLSGKPPPQLFAWQIAAKLDLHRTTVSAALKRQQLAGRVFQPAGPHGGWAITPAGQKDLSAYVANNHALASPAEANRPWTDFLSTLLAKKPGRIRVQRTMRRDS